MTTAINIGFSCRLLTTQMELITLDKEGPGEDRAPVAHRLKACYDKYGHRVHQHARKAMDFVIISKPSLFKL